MVALAIVASGGITPCGVQGLQTSAHVGGFHPAAGMAFDSMSLAERQGKIVLAYRYIRPVREERISFEAIDRARDLAVHRRSEAIEELDALGRADPANDWLIGHRVGLRVKAGLESEALKVARECRGSAWWCSELTGFVLHVMEEFDSADSAFHDASRRMPEAERCGERGVNSITFLLERRSRGEYHRMGCTEREALEARFWWLANPLHLTPSNERYTEHRARLVGLRLFEQEVALRGRWGAFRCIDRCWELTVRRGWPAYWWGPEQPFLEVLELSGLSLAPQRSAMEAPLEIEPDDWELDPGAVRERYELPYGPLHALPHQVAFFRRGDSATVVAATDLSRHPLALSGEREVGVILSRGPDDVPVRATTREMKNAYRFRVTTPGERHLVSVEALAEVGGAGRARFGAGLREPTSGGLGVSNLLLFDWAATQEETLEGVYPHMLGTTELAEGDTVGLFWEVYGVEDAETLTVTLRVVPEGTGILRRIGRMLRLVGPADGVRLTWESAVDTPEDEAVLGTSLSFDLGMLDPDRYRLELTVEHQGESLTEVRRFSVR